MPSPLIIGALVGLGIAVVSARGYHLYIDHVARRVGGQFHLTGHDQNAFAHAFASAHLTYHTGPNFAKEVGDAKEVPQPWNGSARWDAYRDLFNNEMGRQIGFYARRRNFSREQMEDLLIETLLVGDLIVRENDRRIPRNFDEEPFSFDVTQVQWAGPRGQGLEKEDRIGPYYNLVRSR